MDLKVYKKETVEQPSGAETIITPNVIDIYPEYTMSNGVRQLSGAELLKTEKEIIEQACTLATIWQKGLDPLAKSEGIRWSEAILEEINVLQLMEDIVQAVNEITPTVDVTFTTVTDANGVSYLKYTLKAGA